MKFIFLNDKDILFIRYLVREENWNIVLKMYRLRRYRNVNKKNMNMYKNKDRLTIT